MGLWRRFGITATLAGGFSVTAFRGTMNSVKIAEGAMRGAEAKGGGP